MCSAVITSQELPPIQNFSSKHYHAENQNWTISQSPDKLIYVANNKGLLEYNGAEWTLYPSPNETIIRSVKVVNERIYTGCYMEFGYWQKDDFGELKYTSLSQQIDIQLIEDEEFWNIFTIDDWVIFQSLSRIYIVDVKDKSAKVIDSKTRITKMFQVERSIYFQRLNQGIFKIENGKDVLISDDSVFKQKEVINIFSSDKGLLILTRDNGFYDLTNGLLQHWSVDSSDLISSVSIYSAIQLKNGGFAIGTISDGLIYLDNNGKLLYQINQNKGLINNTVLSVFEDIDDTIWLGLDNGISYINGNSPFKIYKDKNGILGSVYTSVIHNSNLYLGTNQGLFYKNIDSNEDFKFIEGTQGQVWSLKIIDNTLFCGHHTGTYIVQNSKVKRVSNVPGTWAMNELTNKNNLILQGNYDGLYVLEKVNENWQLRNKIEGFDNSARYFEVLDNTIFVNHEYKGVFSITIDSSFSNAQKIAIDSTLKGANSSIINYNGDISYAQKNGIFKYSKTEKKFRKDSVLSSAFVEKDYVSGKLVFDNLDDKLWLFTRSNLIVVSPGELTNTPKINSIPLSVEERNDVVEYENIIRYNDDGVYLLGSNSGYILVDSKDFLFKDVQVEISKIISGSHKKNKLIKKLINKNEGGNFKNSESNLEIHFYSPEYSKYLKPTYQFQLLGIYDDWGDWSETPKAIFENLAYGDYTFNVRARIGDKVSSSIATYSFSIAKPWHISNLMLALYALAIILFSIFMHNVYKRYYNKEQQKLVEKNKRELKFAKVQNEKEIIKIKNEQLKEQFKNKSKELAASTMSIVKKNELLASIKDQLLNTANNKESITPILDTIDNSLRKNDDWEFFKEAFNNVDRKFLKKLNKLHPNLSPKDIKLCAYLRLNLSSKEIAPLFNISARSVEIKRYRLRKKMNLSHEDNLVNYIIEL